MPNWVLATIELPEDIIGFVINDENNWFSQENGGYEHDYYEQEYNDNGTRIYTEMWDNCSLSLINTTYITSKKSSDDYHVDGGFKSRVSTTPVYNDNGHITFGIKLVDNDKLIKGAIPDDYDGEWAYIDIGYNTQNVDDNYVKFECDFKWSGIINEQVLNEIVANNTSEDYDALVEFGSWYANITHTTDDLVNYTSGTNFIWDFYNNDVYDDLTGTENIYILMSDYNETFKFCDDGIDVVSMFFYNRYEDKWYFYFIWSDYNGNNYYYDATDCFINKTWLHVEYSRNGTEGTLKFGDRTYTFLVKKGDVNLRFYSYLMPVNKSEDLIETGYVYTIYGYTQIANLKTYVVPLEEELDFETPYVYVRNSNYRDNFFLSVEVENYDPNGYEVLWDTGARAVSIPCRLGEYHEVTVTNRAGSTKAWNVAGFGDARFYKYRVNVADLLSVSDIGKSSTATINLTNNAEYATQTDCTPSFTCGSSSYTAEVKVVDGHVTIDTTGVSLRACGYYSFNVSRYNQYNTQANGIGFGLSWKMKLLGDIGEWIQYSYEFNPGYDSVSITLDWDVYGFLIADSLYGRNGMRLSVVKSHGELKCVAYSVNNASEKSVLPDEFMNGEWVDCYLYKYDTDKYFFNVNGHTVLNFEDNSFNVESVCLFNTLLAGSMSTLLLNGKTPRVIHSEIKRSMELVKNQWD